MKININNPLKSIQKDWDEMSPSGKAWTVTLGVAITAINPLYTIVYGSTYFAYSAMRDETSTEETNDDNN